MDDFETAARMRTIAKMIAMPLWYTVDELRELMAPYSQDVINALDEWEQQGLIFTVQDDDQRLVGRFQFDAEFRPLPIIAEILTLLAKDDKWAIAAWFAFLNGWISDGNGKAQAPVDALASRDPMVREGLLVAARNERGTYFA